MKRSEMLTSLSHDHHQALRASQLLSRCDEANADEARKGFERFWGPYCEHMRIEEDVLFPKFAEHGGADDPLLARAHEDHETISELTETILEAPEPLVEPMHELAEKLRDHVRFEERNLFPKIEAAIPESEHESLLAALEHPDPGPDWQPERTQ